MTPQSTSWQSWLVVSLFWICLVTHRCADETCGRVQQYAVWTYGMRAHPSEVGSRAAFADGWMVMLGRIFCPRCADLIEDSLDLRPYGPDADIIRQAIDYRAARARMEVKHL